jgi:hypothetical protein
VPKDLLADIDYLILPVSCREGMRRWIEQGIEPGSFLCAVIRNELVEAFIAADTYNRTAMGYFCLFLRHEAPPECWGSREKMDAWQRLRAEAREAEP